MKNLFSLFFVLTSATVFAQTEPGEIYDNAANNPTNPMDPNGDGCVSINCTLNTSAYATGAEDNELSFSAIPQVNPEPDDDTRTGGGCGATDVVDDPSTGADASYVFFDDANDVMVYRLRLAQNATGAFGYSVLVDTDGAFGFTGDSPDPNAVTGNPGFEFEIRFATGSNLFVEDVDGSASTNSTDFTYDLDDNTQRVYARFQDADCGAEGTAVFYDFHIPLSSMGLTESSVIRLAAATASNPSNSILSNPSDIAGVDDDLWPDEDLAYIELISLQGDGTPIGNLGDEGCFLSGTSDTPTVSSPVFDSNTRINGTSTEPDGAFAWLLNNEEAMADTVTMTDGFWTVPVALGSLRPFDEITAIARDSCENASAASVIFNVINDLDSDNDGIPDSQEGNGVDPGGDADGDNIPNYLDSDYPGFTDSNMDGINDEFDPDLDGLPNHLDPDVNGDGLPDIDGAGGGAHDADNDGVIDAMEDADGDGIPDSADVDATMGTDADNDGIDDSVQGGTDTDGDGIQDTDDPDNDNDGLYDGIDEDQGGTPLTITDIDGDGYLDYLDIDADGDGIPNATEGATDDDGDGIPNHQDIDADGDGILDNIEAFTSGG